MVRQNLIVCFDAFGTLFRPRIPVAQQYARVAEQCGLRGLDPHNVEFSLLSAIYVEARRNPNYGKMTGMESRIWWKKVIHNTFKPLIGDRRLPSGMATTLLNHFSSGEGYKAEPDLALSMRHLKLSNKRYGRVLVGVIANSDDRVPYILSSFGLDVSPVRYGNQLSPNILRHPYDIDFLCMSYDVGVEKPHQAIFDAAYDLCVHMVGVRQGQEPEDARKNVDVLWDKIYVGDEHAKDVAGAVDAGWYAMLLDSEHSSIGVTSLEDHRELTPTEAFEKHGPLRANSIKNVSDWLRGDPSFLPRQMRYRQPPSESLPQ